MKEFYFYMGITIIWISFLTYIDMSQDHIFKVLIIMLLIFIFKQLTEIKNNTEK